MSLLTHTSAAASGAAPVTTSPIDTTGATLIVVGMHNISNDDAGLLSDNQSNTWVLKTALAADASRFIQVAYCVNPTTNGSHTFTLGSGAFYPVICVAAFSNTPVSPSPFDAVTAGAFASTPTTTVQPGSLTPANTNNLLVAVMGGDPQISVLINSGFTITDTHLKAAGTQGLSMAYLIQSAATAKNPTWTVGAEDATIGTQMIAFKESGGGGGGSSGGGAAYYYGQMQRLNAG